MEEFEKLEKVQAKIEANLTATQEKAGLTENALSAMATTMNDKVEANVDAIKDMQSQLLTFPAITKDVFEQSMSLVADIAAQTGHGLSETAIMYGKALSSPMDGLQKMMRYGVMFTQQEKDKIIKLQESGHLIEAQKLMMEDIANSGYGGVAEKMFDANPLSRFNKEMYKLQISIGDMATDILHDLTPSLVQFVKAIQDGVSWIKQHKELLHNLLIVAGEGILVWGTYTLALGAVTVGAQLFSGAMSVLTMVMNLNPFQKWVIAIAAATEAIIYCYHHFETFHAVLWAVWGTIKEFAAIVGDIFMGLYHTIHGTFNLDVNEINEGMNKGISAVTNAAQRLGKAAKDGYAEGLADFAQDNAKVSVASSAAAPKKLGGKTAKVLGDEEGKAGKSQTGKAQGTKNTTINITIGNLVHDINIKTSNFIESTSKIKEKITEALTDALNDSQHVAGA